MNNPTDASERLKEAAMAALQAAGGSMQIVNLNKTLFCADLHSLLKFGETITGQEYLAFPNGPVVAGYERRIVKALEKEGLVRQEPAEDGYGKPLVVKREMASFPHITIEKLSMLQAISRDAASKSATWLSHWSHDNPGWILARERTKAANGQAKPINMSFALQQLENEDPWIEDKVLSPIERTAVDAVDGEQGEDWGC